MDHRPDPERGRRHIMMDPVLAHALEGQPRLIDALKTLVAFPSVGADPAMAQGMEDARQFIEARIAKMGFTNCQRLTPADGSGQPAIYAERMDAPGKPTMLVYAHYDVQPADPVEKWHTPPFEATEADGRLYGRGISDDKAPMLIALDTLAAFVAVEGRLPVNVKLLIEGEEEIGSPSLEDFCGKHKELLKADIILVSDTTMLSLDKPTLTIGLRGLAYFEITVVGPNRDLHSGLYGGAVNNPGNALSELIANMKDDNGKIVIPGFIGCGKI